MTCPIRDRTTYSITILIYQMKKRRRNQKRDNLYLAVSLIKLLRLRLIVHQILRRMYLLHLYYLEEDTLYHLLHHLVARNHFRCPYLPLLHLNIIIIFTIQITLLKTPKALCHISNNTWMSVTQCNVNRDKEKTVSMLRTYQNTITKLIN